MLIPIGEADARRRTPWVTRVLVLACVLVFVVAQPWQASTCEQLVFFLRHAVVPLEVVQGAPLSADQLTATPCAIDPVPTKSIWASVVASMFLHAGWLHLGGNLLFLWIFGPGVEERLGPIGFLAAYLGCGVAATAAFVVANPSEPVPLVGASGAIAGILGVYAVAFPARRIVTLVVPLFFLPLRIPALVVLAGWFLLQLRDAGGDAVGAGGGVAYLAHVVGFVAGAGLWLLLATGRGRRGRRGRTRRPRSRRRR